MASRLQHPVHELHAGPILPDASNGAVKHAANTGEGRRDRATSIVIPSWRNAGASSTILVAFPGNASSGSDLV